MKIQQPAFANIQQPMATNIQQQPVATNIQEYTAATNIQQQPVATNIQEHTAATNIQQQPVATNIQQNTAATNIHQPAVANIQAPPTGTSGCKETTAGRYYYIKFEGNNSKRWDGKTISLLSDQIEDIYDPSELIPGFNVTLPWPSKGSKKVTNWKGVIVEPTEKMEVKTPSEL